MCGIAGHAGVHDPRLLARMCAAIAHRGPDGNGFFKVESAGIGLGNQRLAVIDIEGGQQPFTTDDGSVALVYNGEVYNYREVRSGLAARGHRFRTDSDTEVVLAAYLEWGSGAWQRLQGMFALALVDQRSAAPEVRIVRDRVGMKPLYYAARGDQLVFASELKALLVWDGLARDVDLASVRRYFALRYVPGPESLLSAVRKLPAGCELRWYEGLATVDRWWVPPTLDAQEPSRRGADAEAVVGDAMRLAVRRHLVSDVPLGAFLSGGLDSNVIVALMAEASDVPVKTFSIGFRGFPKDELERAALTARHFGTDHHEFECRPEDFADLAEMTWALDEPIGDPIIVPMYVLAREARRNVTVVLSGEGADELFGGYVFHRRLQQLQRLRSRLPAMAFTAGAAALRVAPMAALNRLFDHPGQLGDAGRKKLVRLVREAAHLDAVDLYRSSISLFDAPDIDDAMNEALPRDVSYRGELGPGSGSVLARMLHEQFRDWLQDDILMKSDKLTMAHSLEGRVPFMDEAVIQAAASLPDRERIDGAQTKAALRRFAASILPSEITDAPKAAFYVPLESYLDTPAVADVFRYALDPARVSKRGLVRPEWCRRELEAAHDHDFVALRRLFAVAMLELWFERFSPNASWN